MNRTKWIAVTIVMLLWTVVLAGCGGQPEEQPVEPVETETEQTAEGEQESESGYPKTIIDALENEVVLEEQPERIVSLVPSITETIFALGKGETVVGRTEWDNYPEEVLEVESVGDMNFDVEKVIALGPDLVLSHASNAHSSEEGLNQLRNAGIPVVVVYDAASIDMVYETIRMIGEAVDAGEEAETVIADMQAKFAEVEEKASTIAEEERRKVWVEVSPAPELYTTGKGTFLDEMLTVVNAINAAGEQEGWIPYTEEEAVAFQPDVIVTTYGYYVDNAAEQIKERPAWQDVPAVVNDRIYDLVSDEVTRSGPRLAEGVEGLAKAVYPEVFGE
ncbi:ABC transporter substrate-binding protein [Halalkalibacter oceani]|uniref:ABC transporter substrate-binding protein n=1 Tax=Halalkalibacter oceani TaxID=1653776 RepID=UPI003480A93F